MGWCTTFDLDQFVAAAGGYLRSRAAENSLLLSAVQAAYAAQATLKHAPGQPGRGAAGAGPLLGWWEPSGGGDPRGAFLHDPAVPLLISGRAPELATSLAAALARLGRQVYGVDAPVEAADAFAAAWSQRAGTAVRVHRHCRVYRLALPGASTPPQGTPAAPGRSPAAPGGTPAAPSPGDWPPSGQGAWPPPGMPGPVGRLRVATPEDQSLLADWLAAFATETAERSAQPREVAADLISYGGAVFWEVPHKPARLRDAAHYLAIPHHRGVAQFGEPAHQPVALAALTRPVAGMVRISMVYTPPERRRNGYAAALVMGVSHAVLGGPGGRADPAGPAGGTAGGTAGPAGPGGRHDGADGLLGGVAGPGQITQVVIITDKSRPDRWGGRLGYQLVGERALLRFGPVTGPLPKMQATGPMPRLPTGPLPRLPRLRR